MTHDRDAQGAGDEGMEAQLTADLDAAFAALRAGPPRLPQDLHARVLTDAYAVQDQRAAASRQAPRPAARRPRLAGFWASLGGWGGGAGLVTATTVGLVVGFGAPDVVSGVTVTGLAGTGIAVTETADDAGVAAWLWPDVGTVIDGLSAAGEG